MIGAAIRTDVPHRAVASRRTKTEARIAYPNKMKAERD